MVVLRDFSLDRMVEAVERVRRRLLRATAALAAAKVAYAVVGGHAVAAWVNRLPNGNPRNTPDIDILINEGDFPAARAALESVGFQYTCESEPLFLDGAKRRDSVRLLFVGKKVREDYLFPAPELNGIETADEFQMINLDALVFMKLTSFRLKDKIHIHDMIDAGLLDASWLPRLPPELAARLKQILDTPEG